MRRPTGAESIIAIVAMFAGPKVAAVLSAVMAGVCVAP